MEIFGKRPFASKTEDMDGKLKDIPEQIQEKHIQTTTLAEQLTQNMAEANNVIA